MGERVENVVAEEHEETEAFLDAGDGVEEENVASPDEKEALLVTAETENDDKKGSAIDDDGDRLRLPESERRTLDELKSLVMAALKKHEFGGGSAVSVKPEDQIAKLQINEANVSEEEEDGAKTVEAIEETIVAASLAGEETPANLDESVSIWGVKLMEDVKSDVILLKFLRARDFKPCEALAMIRNTLKWRKEFGIDDLVEEEETLGHEFDRAVFMYGRSREGNPVCYNVYGEFRDKELYRRTFSDEESRRKFLRWRIQFLERSIRKLDFSPGGISTIVQVNDLKNSPGPNRWELRQATNQALHLLQDNYPEFVAKQIFINVPWWYMAVSRMISPFLTQRSKNKFVVAAPANSTETLLKYISAEQLPMDYGGLSEMQSSSSNPATEIILKPSAKHTVEFPVDEGGCVVSWEVRVVGGEAIYGAEFVPKAENGYTVIIQKKMMTMKKKLVSDSYRVGEPGKVVIDVQNLSSKNKNILLYRFNVM